MKELTNIQRATQFLNKVFKRINETYFDNSLEMPVITIQSSIGCYGYITVDKIWNTDGVQRYELNIGAECLNRECYEIVATLEHECIHLYCLMNGIKDTCNHGIYHNRRFKELCETKCCLQIDRHPKYGWTITTATEETINFCIKNDFENIKMNRQGALFVPGSATPTTTRGGVKRPSSTRKYICPCCKSSFRATRNLNVMCMDCDKQYLLA